MKLKLKNYNFMNLEKLFNPKSIAIVGASQEAGSVGNTIAKNILELGYVGEAHLVNPKYENIFGKKCCKKLSDIEDEIDLAIIAIPAKFVVEEIRENAKKIKNFVIISAGFAEINEEGKKREEDLKKIARENNLNILGPNCLGFIIPRLKLNASFAGGMLEEGDVAFITQSGALAVALADLAKKEKIGFSGIFSIGNKMNISETEMLEYLEKDENTKVIGMYLEGIKDGSEFMKIASRVSQSKPIVILKAGKTERSQKAISSHTGALAGSDEIINAVFEKTGIIRALDMKEFLGLLEIISSINIPPDKNVAIVTNAGGLGVLTTDAFKDKKIKLAEISEKMKNKLKKFLPEESSVNNPIDVLGDADEKRYGKTLDALKKENFGTIICLLTPQDQTPVKKIAQKIIKFNEKVSTSEGKNIIAVFMGGRRVEKAMEKLKENNIPVFFFPEEAINALDKYYISVGTGHCPVPTAGEINTERKEKATSIIQKAKTENRSALLFSEAAEIMKMYGIKTVETFYENAENIKPACNAMRSIAGRFPVVVKIDSDKVLHKTDKQGVILNIKNQEELEEAIAKIRNNFPGENFIIQPMRDKKTELILGIKKDDIFGPVIVFGLGGIYTEVFKMVDFLLPPAGQKEIEEKLLESKIKFLFQETRGQKPHNLEEIAGIIEGLNYLAQELLEIELDINPLLVYNDGKEAVAVDVKIII